MNYQQKYWYQDTKEDLLQSHVDITLGITVAVVNFLLLLSEASLMKFIIFDLFLQIVILAQEYGSSAVSQTRDHVYGATQSNANHFWVNGHTLYRPSLELD
jgi:hypothetical protein